MACWLLLLAFAPPALAADVVVSSNVFTPPTVTINHGDSVTWTNTGGFHNVVFDDGSFTQPATEDDSLWKVTRPTFIGPASLRYYCAAHGAAGGVGMSGTVVVNAPGSSPPGGSPPGGTPPGGSPGQGGAGSPVSDRSAPTVALGARAAQRVLRRRSVSLTVRSSEQVTVTARGTVAVPNAARVYTLRKITRELGPNVERRLALKLSVNTLRAVRRALRRGVRLSAKLTVSATDRANNSRTVRRNVRLRP